MMMIRRNNMDELKVDLKPETYTELTVTILDYEGTKRIVTLCESGWDHGIQSLHEMWTRLLGGMGFASQTIETFYDQDGEETPDEDPIDGLYNPGGHE
jgi:hypothetical protein